VGNAQRITHASRTSRTVPFGAPIVEPAFDSGQGDADPTLSADGRVLIFSSNRTGSGFAGSNMWYSTRAAKGSPWSTPVPVPDVNGAFNEGDPWLSPDGCRLFFASDRSGAAQFDFDIWSSKQ
jgi:Tol biopolymer transport system component